MRLTPKEMNNLIIATAEFLDQHNAELRIFGSRANNQLKGGDIDLLLLVPDTNIKSELSLKKHLILARIKELIGDQKIDLKISEINELKEDPFLQSIYPQSICLKKF